MKKIIILLYVFVLNCDLKDNSDLNVTISGTISVTEAIAAHDEENNLLDCSTQLKVGAFLRRYDPKLSRLYDTLKKNLPAPRVSFLHGLTD